MYIHLIHITIIHIDLYHYIVLLLYIPSLYLYLIYYGLLADVGTTQSNIHVVFKFDTNLYFHRQTKLLNLSVKCCSLGAVIYTTTVANG